MKRVRSAPFGHPERVPYEPNEWAVWTVNFYTRKYLPAMAQYVASYPHLCSECHTMWVSILLQDWGVDALVDSL